ncbi:MAG: FAD-binding protein, partial [Flavobacteriaceae bacterium]|nr:FAD-binding protein [Flavobacteriaceae bacterium]
MVLKEQVSLAPYTTFGVPAKAFQFCEVISSSELQSLLLSAATKPILVLGGGSNILFTKDFEGMVIHLQNKGITIVEETTDWVTVEAKAGENWHQFVLWCIEQDFGGVENLSLIPGNVGTAPIQNIGAYGVELQDVFLRCTTMHITTGKEVIFQKEECEFGYRDSIFKGIVKGQYIITSVQFRLTKNNHKLHISYGAIASELAKNNIENP